MVYFVGAGAGCWNNISVKGLELIKKCDVIIYDRLIDNKLLDFVKDDCKKIYVGKASDNHSMKQEDINSTILYTAEKYNIVVRLKGGDSFVFGRGGEEADICIKNNIRFEFIPGVTSAIAIPEICGIPVTHRGVSQDFHIITGHTAEEDNINYDALAKLSGTIVILMGIKNIGRIAEKLMKNGKDGNTPIAFIEENGKRVFKTILSKSEDCVVKNNIVPPGIIVIGQVVDFNFKCRKKSVAIIGTEDFKTRLSSRLDQYDIIDVGTLAVKKYNFKISLDYDYIVLTSRNGVRIFIEYLFNNNIDFRNIRSKFAVIGKGTYDVLSQYGIYADIIPDRYTAYDLSKKLSKYKGSKLILRAEKGSRDLYEYIENYDDVKIYDIEGCNIKETDADYIVFASSSAVDLYCKNYKINSEIIAIGSVTAERLKNYGYSSHIADSYSIDGIIKKLEVLENEKNEKAQINS